MRQIPSAGIFCALLCVAVLAVVAVAACSLAAAAPARNIITIALPESDAAVQAGADGFSKFTGTGIQYIGQPGEPSLPYQSVNVLLPPDADLSTVEANITGYEWIRIAGGWDVAAAGPLVTGEHGDTAGEAIAAARGAGIYESDSLFPLEPVRRVDVQELREWKTARVFYAPFAYNPVERALYQLSGNAIEISFERATLEGSFASADLTVADHIREMTVNFAEVSGEYGGFGVSADTGRYVIITTSAIQAASSSLMDYVASKEARGFTVQVVTEATWGGGTGDAAAENLRAWLQGNYVSLNIKYVLLIGNPNPTSGTVPMKMCYPQEYDMDNDDCPTDFYYAELTSDWDTDEDGQYGEYADDFLGNPPRGAEVAVGRIPYYGSVTDLDHILSKIIDYENAPASTIAWRENVLLPMEPSDEDTPGWQLGEEIKDDALPAGWTYHRVYDEYNTRYCDPGDPGYVTGIPEDTETKSCTVTNVTDVWKATDFGAVFWWTHGSETSATDVMNLTGAGGLDDGHPGFTFQASCLNGYPETTTNLGYSLLKKGCVSTVSASRVSWYREGQTSFAGTPTNSGMAFEYASRLITSEMYAGDALNDLRLDVYPYDEVLWMNYLDFNIYGCPAVGLFNSAPDQDAPSVVTYYASNVSYTSARLRASLTSLGTADNVTVSFEWGTASGVYTDNNTPLVESTTGTFYFDVSSLDPAETYYYRARAVGDGTTYGLEKSFTTLTTPPAVTTDLHSNLGSSSVTLNSTLTSMGTATSVTLSFEWGTQTGVYTHETDDQPVTGTGVFSDNLTGITPGSTYYYRAKAVGHGIVYGTERNFTTLASPPGVTTDNVSNLTSYAATLNGTLTSMGTATSVTVSFQYGLTSSYGHTTTAQVLDANGTFSASLTGLTGKTTYHYRAKVVGDGTAYGDDLTFYTPPSSPEVATGGPSKVTGSGAQLNGNLLSKGTADDVTVSFEWGTDSGIYPFETTGQVTSATGAFYFQLGSLAYGQTFYYRAKAVGDGTEHGDERSFTTGITPASVATSSATNVTGTAATLHGNLADLGSAASVSVCFQWGTAPGVYVNETTVVGKAVSGAFDFGLTGLNPGTGYYFRAKAVGDGGAVYGEEKSFATFLPPEVSGAVPGSGNAGQRFTVVITGANFTGVTGVSFGGGTVVDSFTVVSDAWISAAIFILCDATPGTRDVAVTTPGGTDLLPGGFAIGLSAPGRPRNTSPGSNLDITTLTPVLTASAFSHLCPSCTQAASQWQVTAISGDYSNPIDDTTVSGGDLTRHILPMGVIGSWQQYWWRVRYQDERGAWSDWSVETSFCLPDFIQADLDGAAEIRVHDSASGVTGVVDGRDKEEIPDSEYVEGNVVLFSTTGSYRYQVVGTEGGTYTLVITRAIGNTRVVFRAVGIPISDGEVHLYSIDWEALSDGRETVTIDIDPDGDGEFERTLLMDGDIDSSEFASAAKEKSLPSWVWILVAVGVIAGTITLLALLRADRQRKRTAAGTQVVS